MRTAESKTLTVPNTGEDVMQQETYFTEGKNAHWYSHGGAQSAVSYSNSLTYHVIQQSCSLIFTQMNGKLCSRVNLHVDGCLPSLIRGG